MTQVTIACRPGCLSLPPADAMVKLNEIGITHVEVSPPADGDYAALAQTAHDAGVAISSIGTAVRTDRPESVEALHRVIDGTAGIGTQIIFLSASHGEATFDDGIAALRNLAERAQGAGVILSIETHPPFGHNGKIARKTLECVNSDGIGFNYDTANIYYYNPQGVDGIAQLKMVLPFVTSVHLKESAKGEPKSFDFPVLGQGIVNFPDVFRLLGQHGFTGPYTLELEGQLVDGLPVEQQAAKVRACLDYLRQIGATTP